MIKFEMHSGLEFDSATVLDDARTARAVLETRSGPGSDFLGWLNLPEEMEDQISRIEEAAENLRKNDALVLIGIGGSYLGGRALIEGLRDPFQSSFPVYYAGHNLDAYYHDALLKHLSQVRYSINVISKSGTTTEPGIAFRLFFQDLRERFGEAELNRLICVTTDKQRGALKQIAEKYSLKSFIIPDDLGGRFSVFSPVGMLPAAAAGVNIRKVLSGAGEMMKRLRDKNSDTLKTNPALAYACFRNAAYRSGKKIEIFTSYVQSLSFVSEWWKQLFGESEGKEGRGIFPASVNLTTDLHSLGQWIQEGERSIFETILDVESQPGPIVPVDSANLDGLNYLAGRSMHDVNRTALEATMEAHISGGVPCFRIGVPNMTEENLGALLYMFEYACGISAYMLKVNPFDQPGVETYKKRMFQMLGKPD